MTALQTLFKAEVVDIQALKEVASAMTSLTRDEPGVLAYEWSLCPEAKQLRVYESYSNSQACLEHLAHVAELSPKLMGSVNLLEIEVYGEPGEQFIEATKDYPMRFMGKFDGFRR